MSKKAAEDVAGSLKVHIKIALEIDIQITARIKGVSGTNRASKQDENANR